MATPPFPRAAGAPLALAILAGAVIGTLYRQPTIGVLTGFAVGMGVVLLIWWRDPTR